MKNPIGYGTVVKLSGNRRRPYTARKTKGWDERGYPVYETIGYYTTREEGLIALAEYNRNPFDMNASKITVKELYDNVIAQIPKRLAATTEHLATVRQQIEAARAEAGKPFPQEAELKTKSARLAELDAALNMDRSSGARQKDISHSDNAR